MNEKLYYRFIKYKKKNDFLNGWKESPIDEVDEITRHDDMLDRNELVINLNIKEYVYYTHLRRSVIYKLVSVFRFIMHL